MRAPRSGYLPSLDGWRAIAIAAVIFAHDPDEFGPGRISTAHLRPYGWAGVDLFFAISGLLICSRLLEEERMNGSIALRDFYVRRFFRIFPPAWLFLTIYLVLAFLHQLPMGLAATGAAVLMIRNFWGAFGGDPPNEVYTDHFWSLSVEEHFYLILPAIMVFAKRRVQIVAWLTAAAATWFVFMARFGTSTGNLFLSRTDLRIHGLLLPALLALLLARPDFRAATVRWLRPWLCITVTCLLMLALRKFPLSIRLLQAGLCFPLLVASTMIHPSSIACRVLEWKPLRYVGRLSYGIYLWQQIFLIRGVMVHWPFVALQQFPVKYIGIFACSAVSYYLLEKPMIAWGHRLAPPATPGRRDVASGADAGTSDQQAGSRAGSPASMVREHGGPRFGDDSERNRA
jgi:peptidoglycan/LPS O-acetylase OafA/YrhL